MKCAERDTKNRALCKGPTIAPEPEGGLAKGDLVRKLSHTSDPTQCNVYSVETDTGPIQGRESGHVQLAHQLQL